MAISVWNNVAVDVQSALGSAITITGITAANPAVVTYSGVTDPANGDYILMSVTGMSRLNNRVFRIANVNAAGNTLELEGQNTTGFSAFVSGSYKVITFGTPLTIVSDVQPSGGDIQLVDASVVHEDFDKSVPGNFTQTEYSMTCQWVPDDTGLLALKQASDTKAERAIRMSFTSTGAKFAFNGYVSCSLNPSGQAKQLVTTPVKITASGRVTTYAT